MGDVEKHLAVVREPAAHFFVERQKEPVHLEADGTGAGLALARARRILTQIAQVFAAHAVRGQVPLNLFAAAVIDKDLEVHFGLAAKLIDIAEKLALVRTDGFAQGLIVIEDSAEAEGKNGGMLKTIGDDACMVDARLLVENFLRIVLAYDHGEIAGWI
jgi:hypothetical protein